MTTQLRRWLHGPPLTAAVFVLALLPRLYRLDAQSLWLDEGSSWALASRPWPQLLLELFQPSAAYPLYHLLLKAWIAVAGDSEWALRLPSAVAGALAAALLVPAARELARLLHADGLRLPLAAALLGSLAPFALWYSQEAKVYALLLLSSSALLWATLRALRLRHLRSWLPVLLIAAVSLFIHRLAALQLPAVAAAWLLSAELPRGRRLLFAGGLALASLLLAAALAAGFGSERAASGAAPAVSLAAAGWLTLLRFTLDRWPGDAPWFWLLPWLALQLLALARLAALRRSDAALLRALLGLAVVPPLIFAAQLLVTRLYEPRYLIGSFPLWLLLTATAVTLPGPPRRAAYAALALSGVVSGAVLLQPTYGLFSGDPVKEEYRSVFRELAARLHPDDAVVLHPGYLRPLYAYYLQRQSADPAPAPITFADFWSGETAYGQREWDVERRARLVGFTRSWLVIAPDHARTVDPPLAGDEYGLVGNYWAFSREQRAWPCGIWRRSGVHLFCQESPEAYISGAPVVPQQPQTARFGDRLQLLGTTVKTTDPSGAFRAGGNLPISFFWEVSAPLERDLSLFIHLCRDCAAPPLAADDGPPLQGYLPTSSWLPGKPARDDRSVELPADLPPGRYTVLIGWYDPSDPTPAGRLPVSGDATLPDGRLRLLEIDVVAADS
jgi:mannosyltransferase